MDLLCKSVREITSPFDCLLFDLDDTLYSSKTGIAAACKRNIEDFLVEKCGFDTKMASTIRIELFKKYGSTLAGLRALGYDIAAEDYHNFVHGRLPYDAIKPDLQLRNLLGSISQRKLIFTNSDQIHAMKVLERLGLQDCFDQIICFETINPNLSKSIKPDDYPVVLKPSIDAMKIAIDAAEIDPRRTLFLDDNERNVAAGKAVGLRTVLTRSVLMATPHHGYFGNYTELTHNPIAYHHVVVKFPVIDPTVVTSHIQVMWLSHQPLDTYKVGNAVKSKEADYAVENINNLKQVVPEIWMAGSGMDVNDQRINRTRSETEFIQTVTTVGA